MKMENLSVLWRGMQTTRAMEKSAPLAKQLNAMLVKPQAQARKTSGDSLLAMLARPQTQARKTAGANSAEVAQKRRQYEQELRACRTKEEVEAVRRRWLHMAMAEMSAINSSNLSTAAKQAALEKIRLRLEEQEEVCQEFKKTARFHTLPDKEDDKKQNNVREAMLEEQNQGADMEVAQEQVMPLPRGMTDALTLNNRAPPESDLFTRPLSIEYYAAYLVLGSLK
ncbi:MAG: hypothetical protein FWG81_11225 [Betaproteobacteria bacterium]|nr:hypothetical protein [Betaproteobacteria bacterium]